MTDIVTAAFITVTGTVVVAVASTITQLITTRSVIASERERTREQIELERQARASENRIFRLTEVLADLLAESDPQVNYDIAYSRVVVLIHRAQLVIDRDDEAQAALCDAINKLGLVLQEYIPHHHKPARERIEELKNLLGAHAQVAKLGSELVAKG